MYRYPRLIICLTTVLAGCGQLGVSHAPPDSLSVVGPWSENLGGLRCRIRLASNHVKETGGVLAAVEVLNTSARALEFATAENSSAPDVIWSIGPTLYIDARQDNVDPRVRIPAGSSRRIGPRWLDIAPSVNPRPGPLRVSASLALGSDRLAAPPVNLWIAPATWGPATDGLRLCLAADRDDFVVRGPIRLLLYLHNLRALPLEFPAPDWSAPAIRSEERVVTLTYKAEPGAAVIQLDRASIQRHELLVKPIFTRPGAYRLRVAIDGLSAPAGSSPSTLVSNEITLRVESAASSND